MTKSPHQTIVAVVLTVGTMFLLSTDAMAQQHTELPPSLRAAQVLNQQSTGVIDQLLQNANSPASQTGTNSSQAANGLRGTIKHERHLEQTPHRRTASQRPPYAQPAKSQSTAHNTTVDSVAFTQDRRQTDSSVSSSSDEAWDRILQSGSNTVNLAPGTSSVEPGALAKSESSFIEQEKADPTKQDQSTAALIKKISINLMFVLAIAFGILLLVKHWQRGRGVGKKNNAPESNLDALNVSQVLPLTNGASLHVVQGSQNQFLVAIDASGIKSVNVLGSSFDETMKQVETRQQRRESNQKDEPTTYKFVDPNEDASEIDEKLIKMLLQRTPSVA